MIIIRQSVEASCREDTGEQMNDARDATALLSQIECVVISLNIDVFASVCSIKLNTPWYPQVYQQAFSITLKGTSISTSLGFYRLEIWTWNIHMYIFGLMEEGCSKGYTCSQQQQLTANPVCAKRVGLFACMTLTIRER